MRKGKAKIQSWSDIPFDPRFFHLHLGQDGTGRYGYDLPATVDELMIFGGALSEGEIAALAAYYGKG